MKLRGFPHTELQVQTQAITLMGFGKAPQPGSLIYSSEACQLQTAISGGGGHPMVTYMKPTHGSISKNSRWTSVAQRYVAPSY